MVRSSGKGVPGSWSQESSECLVGENWRGTEGKREGKEQDLSGFFRAAGETYGYVLF